MQTPVPEPYETAEATLRARAPSPATTRSWTRVRSSGHSHPGEVRDHNEDCFVIARDQSLFVVADGMGGHAHGETASLLAVQAIQQSLELDSVGSSAVNGDSLALNQDLDDPLARAIRCAHVALRTAARDNSKLDGMGSTVVALRLGGTAATIAHVGDSRAYRVRGNRLVQLTEDHSLAQLMFQNRVIPQSCVRTHPWRHVLTRSLGGPEEPRVEVTRVDVTAGDVFLLCSDGLTNMLSEERILDRVRCAKPLAARCRQLVNDANSMGGRDNITVVLVAVE